MRFRRHPVANLDKSDPLAAVPLDSALIGRLKATYGLIRLQELRFAELFYERLFAAAPELRSMFRSEPRVQAEKLTASLDAIVRNLAAPESNVEMLAALGRRHAEYGARPEHYDMVIDLLIESMRDLLGPAVTQVGLDEWRVALRLVSDQMIAASQTLDGPKAE